MPPCAHHALLDVRDFFASWHGPQVCSATRRSPGLTKRMNSARFLERSRRQRAPDWPTSSRCRSVGWTCACSGSRSNLRRSPVARADRSARSRIRHRRRGNRCSHARRRFGRVHRGVSGLWQVRQPALLRCDRRPPSALRRRRRRGSLCRRRGPARPTPRTRGSRRRRRRAPGVSDRARQISAASRADDSAAGLQSRRLDESRSLRRSASTRQYVSVSTTNGEYERARSSGSA